MLTQLTSLIKSRPVRLGLEVAFILLIWFSVKLYLQRDLPSGKVPALDGILINDETVTLQSYRGQPILLHFWATWCSVCQLEQNSINNINKTNSVVSVAMQSGTAAEINSFMKSHALNFPVIADTHGSLSHRFGVNAVPTSFIVDSQGRIAFAETGYTTEWGLRLRLWLAD